MTPEEKQEVLDKLVFNWKAAFGKLLAENKSDQTKRFVQPLKPFIKEVNQQGKVKIGFSSDVFIVPNLQIINNGTVYLD